MIEVDTAGAPALTWAEGDALALGRPVFGVAATAGGGVRVTFGLVSAVAQAFRGPGGRRIAGSVEHTAPLAPRSSGSALVDAEGRLIGLNTNRIGEGFYLALPADAALRARVDALGGARPRPASGSASSSPPTTSPDGCAARSGWPTGPASSSVAWMRAVWPPRPASSRATSSCRPAVDR